MKQLLILIPILFTITTAVNFTPKNKNNAANINGKGIETWALINGKNYYFSEYVSISWDDSVKACEDMNMTLINIETQEENDAIFNFITADAETEDLWRWTSGKRLANTTDWTWTGTGEIFPAYTNWGVDQPSNDISIESCCNFAAFFGGWDDDGCVDWLLSYACEEI